MTHPDPEAFNSYEQCAWNVAAPAYLEGFGSLVRQSVAPLLDALDVRPGTALLDIACGAGFVAGAAAERGASPVVGIDASSTMLEEARRRYPGIELHEGNAESLPFPDASFDAVACNFGILHFGQPEQAVAEMFRILRPGGSAGFTVWDAPPATAAYVIVLGAIERFGRADVGLPPGPPFFRFSDPAEARRVLEQVGFSEIRTRTVEQTWRLSDPEQLFEVMRDGTGRTRGILLGQTETALGRIREAIIEDAQGYMRDGKLLLAMPSVMSSGRKRHGG